MALKKLLIRRGSSAQWAEANPVLALGEFGYETNSEVTVSGYKYYKFKIGDGENAWEDLPYIGIGNPSGGGGGGGPVSWDDVTDKPSTFAPSAHTHAWADVTGKPTTFTPSAHSHSWSEITSKPTEFTPIAHQHPWTDITDKPTEFPAEQHTHSMSEVSGLTASLASKATVSQVTAAIDALKDGVSTAGDTLQKLYSLILSSQDQFSVANIAERDALNVQSLGIQVFVVDDGDGKWALYKPTTTGVGASFIKISDPDLLNAVMTAVQIKTAYESNPDTNAYTNTEKSKLASITAIFTTSLKSSYDTVVDWLNMNQTDVADAVFKKHAHSNMSVLDAITSGVKSGYDIAVTWISTNGSSLIDHLTNTSNPHIVTKAQVGLSAVDNTADGDKPVSTAQAVSIATKQASNAALTEISGLAPSNDDVLQRKSGAWVNRTIAQLVADLGIVGATSVVGGRINRLTNQTIANGSAWVKLGLNNVTASTGGTFYVGSDVVIPESGWYWVGAEATFDGTGLASVMTGYMQLLATPSGGAAAVIGQDERQVAINSMVAMSVTAWRYFTTGTVLEVQVYHTDMGIGSGRNIVSQGDHSPDIIVAKWGGQKGDTGATGPAATQAIRATFTGITIAASSGNRFLTLTTGVNTATESLAQLAAEFAMTLTGLVIRTTNTQSALGALVFTIRKNGVDTGIALTIAAGAVAGVYTATGSVSIAAGDLISLRAVNSAASASTNITQYSLVYQ